MLLTGEETLNSSQKSPELNQGRTLYVIQPIIKQAEQELFFDEEIGMQTCQTVGIYHIVNGKLFDLGEWRAALPDERTCNMTTGQAWKLESMVMSIEPVPR